MQQQHAQQSQSKTQPPHFLADRIGAFHNQLRESTLAPAVAADSEAAQTFVRHRTALATQLREPDKTVYEEYYRFARAVDRHQEDWHRRDEIASSAENGSPRRFS